MKLSVIIPVYRVEQTLGRCVESIIGQTFADFELILVDDGSPDRCPQMCDEFAKNDTRIHVIHKENGGLSDARNAGIDKAKGEYITFVDSDDYIEPDTYKPLMNELIGKHDIDMIEFPVIYAEGSRNQKRISFGVKEYRDMSAYWLQAYGYEHCYACNKIYKRHLFHQLRYTKGHVFEDVEIMPKLLKQCRCIHTTEQGLYHYCYNPSGITSTATGKDLNQLLENHLEIMKDPVMPHDARYYMHVLNIQMDVAELYNVKPQLPLVRIHPFVKGLTIKNRIKSITLNLFGIKGICHINRCLHKLFKSHS